MFRPRKKARAEIIIAMTDIIKVLSIPN
jgi:hypothetical protein